MGFGFYEIAKERPDDVAVVDAGGARTWASFDDRVNRIGRALEASGIERGDHIAMLMGNRAEFVEIASAAVKAGLVVTPVNWHLKADEVRYVVENCDAKALFVDDQLLETGTPSADLPDLRVRLVTAGASGEFESYEDAIASASDAPLPADNAPGGTMLYTSGTTGRPKGVSRNVAPAGSTVEGFMTVLAMTGAPLGLKPGGAHLVTGPLYHAAPLGFSTISFNLGNPLVIMDKWSPEDTLSLMTRWGITDSHLVPTMFIRLLRLPEEVRAGFDASELRAIVHGAAPCPVWAKEQMIEWWGPVLVEYYGATEGGLTVIDSEDWLQHRGSVGKPLPVYTVEIRDDSGDVLQPNDTGTVYFRALAGPDTFEYYKDAAKTSAAHVEPGVFTLGDVGHLDDDGYVWLTDRKTDMIISGGVNIYPAEVEQVLGQHPAVADVAVFGVPHEEFGEEVKAAVELLPGHDPSPELEAELIAWCRDRVAHFKCPRSVDFEAELPRHTTGKLYKRLLRDKYWDREARFI
jgi:long-chain acyl-CoA synthetase